MFKQMASSSTDNSSDQYSVAIRSRAAGPQFHLQRRHSPILEVKEKAHLIHNSTKSSSHYTIYHLVNESIRNFFTDSTPMPTDKLTTPTEIEDIIKGLKNRKAPEEHRITNRYQLTNLCNSCLHPTSTESIKKRHSIPIMNHLKTLKLKKTIAP